MKAYTWARPLLLSWINFTPSMDKLPHAHFECNDLSRLGFKLIHINKSKRGFRYYDKSDDPLVA